MEGERMNSKSCGVWGTRKRGSEPAVAATCDGKVAIVRHQPQGGVNRTMLITDSLRVLVQICTVMNGTRRGLERRT